VKTYKGFDKDLKCLGFQYEIGKDYSTNDDIKCCNRGFHSCENPLDVFNYYAPGQSRFCETEIDGKTDRDGSDSKVCASKIKIGAEISLKSLIESGIKFIFEKVKVSKETMVTSGDGANSATSGDGANSATSGYGANSATSGKESIAAAIGINSKAKAAKGSWIVLSEWKQDIERIWHIKSVKSANVDGKKIKADTWYSLKNGKFVKEV
jgi:hypothetical protein